MKHSIFLEQISARRSMIKAPPRPYVAEVMGFVPGGLARRFVQSQSDWRHANSLATRGARLLFIVESGRLYEIREPQTWNRTIRFWAVWDETGKKEELTTQEAMEWLRKNT